MDMWANEYQWVIDGYVGKLMWLSEQLLDWWMDNNRLQIEAWLDGWMNGWILQIIPIFGPIYQQVAIGGLKSSLILMDIFCSKLESQKHVYDCSKSPREWGVIIKRTAGHFFINEMHKYILMRNISIGPCQENWTFNGQSNTIQWA